MAQNDSTPSPEGHQRIHTALFLLPGLLLVWYGGLPGAVVVLLAGAVMLLEVLKVAGIDRGGQRGAAIIAFGLAPAVLGLIAPVYPATPDAKWFVVGACALGLLVLGRSWPMTPLLIAVMLALASGIGLVLGDADTPWLVLTVVVIAAADIAAYVVGKRVGGAKMAPSISPSKTWSGAAAGVVAGCIAGAVLGVLFSLPVLAMAIAGLVVAALSIGGDLLESMFKRSFGVKDAGSILPGHGGLLDRFDGYLLALPVVYLAVNLGWI